MKKKVSAEKSQFVKITLCLAALAASFIYAFNGYNKNTAAANSELTMIFAGEAYCESRTNEAFCDKEELFSCCERLRNDSAVTFALCGEQTTAFYATDKEALAMKTLYNSARSSEYALRDFLLFSEKLYPTKRRALILCGFTPEETGELLGQMKIFLQNKSSVQPYFSYVALYGCLSAEVDLIRGAAEFSESVVAFPERLTSPGIDFCERSALFTGGSGFSAAKKLAANYYYACCEAERMDFFAVSVIDSATFLSFCEELEAFCSDADRAVQIDYSTLLYSGVSSPGGELIDLKSLLQSVGESEQLCAKLEEAIIYRRCGVCMAKHCGVGVSRENSKSVILLCGEEPKERLCADDAENESISYNNEDLLCKRLASGGAFRYYGAKQDGGVLVLRENRINGKIERVGFLYETRVQNIQRTSPILP